jgi:hypothetical protein
VKRANIRHGKRSVLLKVNPNYIAIPAQQAAGPQGLKVAALNPPNAAFYKRLVAPERQLTELGQIENV